MKIADVNIFKLKALKWANSFDVCCYLDSNQYIDSYSKYEVLIAAGKTQFLECKAGSAFNELQQFYNVHKDWMFGLFSYELKNEIEPLTTNHNDDLHFPDLYFFIPEYLIAIAADNVRIIKGGENLMEIINNIKVDEKTIIPNLKIEAKLNREAYINRVQQLQRHIKRGDCYEINFCQEFFAKNAHIDPLQVYHKLTNISPTPFAGFLKINDKYILSATPERFLCKRGQRLISQPIKGTAKRSAIVVEDQQIKERLKSSIKEQAENVMIVDLVRNDLTKSAKKGTVTVDELFGIYSFPQVHQMISTISCQLDPNIHFISAIKNTFPMGSMTGAPKIRAMELIDQYEESKRGAFSGSFGCISPDGDFDFNVIIRSILYNHTQKYLSFQVGGAITYAANAEEEYEECLLKASAILQILATR